MGCGKESKPNKCDTPGWKLRDSDTIDNDIRGFKRMFLKRNHPKFIQTSLHCVQSWRANCDISILIYESDPKNPDPNEIAKVTDYVVNYACKGNLTLAVKKKTGKGFHFKVSTCILSDTLKHKFTKLLKSKSIFLVNIITIIVVRLKQEMKRM